MSDAWLYGEDPKRYPFDTGRLRAVIEKAASEAGWGRKLEQGRGLGISAHRSFVSYTAVVTEVAVSDKGEITIPRVDIAFDCGAVVNPDTVRAQVQSAIMFGTTAALYGEITLKNGRVEQTNFDTYQILRMNEAPAVDVHIVENLEVPGGMGECGTSAIVPAIANAIFAATGKRLRKMPIDAAVLKQSA
jgi:isoquinoline 1-oxidoreductase beta subunit